MSPPGLERTVTGPGTGPGSRTGTRPGARSGARTLERTIMDHKRCCWALTIFDVDLPYSSLATKPRVACTMALLDKRWSPNQPYGLLILKVQFN